MWGSPALPALRLLQGRPGFAVLLPSEVPVASRSADLPGTAAVPGSRPAPPRGGQGAGFPLLDQASPASGLRSVPGFLGVKFPSARVLVTRAPRGYG